MALTFVSASSARSPATGPAVGIKVSLQGWLPGVWMSFLSSERQHSVERGSMRPACEACGLAPSRQDKIQSAAWAFDSPSGGRAEPTDDPGARG